MIAHAICIDKLNINNCYYAYDTIILIDILKVKVSFANIVLLRPFHILNVVILRCVFFSINFYKIFWSASHSAYFSNFNTN